MGFVFSHSGETEKNRYAAMVSALVKQLQYRQNMFRLAKEYCGKVDKRAYSQPTSALLTLNCILTTFCGFGIIAGDVLSIVSMIAGAASAIAALLQCFRAAEKMDVKVRLYLVAMPPCQTR